MNKTRIQEQIFDYIATTFEVSRDEIHLDSDLKENLNLDSIDAVDLMVKVQELTGRKVPPARFENVRTVRDVLDLVFAPDNG
jgi:acyl carrier protein